MPESGHYDVIVIGSGAGGGTLAYALAGSGKRILLLERGDFLPREKDNWDPDAVFLRSKYKAGESWLDRDGNPFEPGIHYWVGGNTKVYGAALLRFRREDFGEVRHHGRLAPAWPITYDDLEPYYTRAERLYRVHGARGQDPTEPPASAPYPYPAVSSEPRIAELRADLERIGLQPFSVPLGIMLDEARPHDSPCIRCDTCDGFPCLVHAKADAEVAAVRPALARGGLELVRNACVERLETDPGGREVRAVHVVRSGERLTYAADVVVVACGAVNSAALLLRSGNDRHPEGLANRSGVVGRHYMCHNNSAFLALSRRPNPTMFQKTLALNDFYFGAPEWGFPFGHIQMLGKAGAAMLKEDAPRGTPRAVLAAMARRSLDFWLTSEDLPDPDNRVCLAPDGRIRLHYTPNNLEGHRRLGARLKGLLGAIGCEDRLVPCSFYLGKKIPIAGVAHQCGTVRFGRDPGASALDANCKAHDLDNLYVVDASFFVSSAAVNPSLTIMANALRVADHLLERMR